MRWFLLTGEEMKHGVQKALECWTLQTLCNVGILATFVVLGLFASRAYLKTYRDRLSLRVAVEAWDAVVDLLTDGLLLFIFLVGLLVTNMDIMADIKIALPWVPLAFVLAGVALMLRVCHGGRGVGTRAWWGTVAAMVLGCAASWFGYTFVMEAAGHEYLALHPAAQSTWTTLANMRSNVNPDLSMTTFTFAAPALVLILVWGLIGGIVQTTRQGFSQAAALPATREGKND